MRTSCLSDSAVTANLFFVTTPCQIADAHCRPAKLRHDLSKPSKSASSPVALRDLKKIQQGLTADALEPIKEVDFPTDAPESEPPGISRLFRRSFRRFFAEFLPERQRPHDPSVRTDQQRAG
jgi:hypothetical protein